MISIITHSIHFNDVDFLFVCFCYQLIDWQFFWSCKNSDFFFASASIDISHAISWNSMAWNGKLVINIVSVFIWSFGMNFQLKTQHLMWTMKSAFVHWNITTIARKLPTRRHAKRCLRNYDWDDDGDDLEHFKNAHNQITAQLNTSKF